MINFISKIQEVYSQIDWSATGSMLAGIGTCIAAVFAILIAHKQNKLTQQIAEKQLKQSELELKIALYDKRYEIYTNFSQYLSYAGLAKRMQKTLTPELNLMFIESIYSRNDENREVLSKKIGSLAKELSDQNKPAMLWMKKNAGLDMPTVQDYEQKAEEMKIIYKERENIDYEFSEQQIRKAKMSKFCYPEEISNYVIKYFSLLFSFDAYKNKKLDYDSLVKCYEEICKNKIIQKMEVLLKLSYDDVSKK